jgi:hypothetical protein
MEVKNMVRAKSAILVVILMVLSTFAVGIAAEAVLRKNVKENIQNNIGQQSFFDAEITFIILTTEGCGCDPIPGITVSAFGGEGNDSGVTDQDGKVILTLTILGEYEVNIEGEGYIPIEFEFNVLDDQQFIFHLAEKDESSTNSFSILQNLVTKILSR